MTRPKIHPTPELVKAVKKALKWKPQEAQRLLIRKRLLDPDVLDGKTKGEAILLIMSKMLVHDRQAYKVLDYLVDEGYFEVEPDRLRRLKP